MRQGALAATLLGLVLGVLAGPAMADGWIVDPTNGCGTSNPFPKPKESISWRGSCRDGKLDGEGLLIWYRDGVETERDQGTFRNGELDGEAVIAYPDGHVIIGNYRDGTRDGEFIVTKPNGQVTVSQYKDGKFLSERQLSVTEAAARAPEINARRRSLGGEPPTRTATGPALPARPRAAPEPVNAAPPRSEPVPRPAPVVTSPMPAPAPAAVAAAPVPLPAPPPVSALTPSAPAQPAIPAPLPMPAPVAAVQAPRMDELMPPSRARVASQPPSPAPSATLAPDLRPVLRSAPTEPERIVLRPPKPRSQQASPPTLDIAEPAPPPSRARLAQATPTRGPADTAPIVLRPPKPRSSGSTASVWVDDSALPPPSPGTVGQAPVLRRPGSTKAATAAPRLRPAAEPTTRQAPPRLASPISPVLRAMSQDVPPVAAPPALRPPPLTPAVTPSPLTLPSSPAQPLAPPTRSGGPAARLEPAGRYSLSLTNADLPQAARVILRDVLGETYTIDPGVVANVTLTPGAPLARDELVQAFREALLVQGVDLRRETAGWRLSNRSQAGTPAMTQVAARNDGQTAPVVPTARANDAESRFVAGFGLERAGRTVEAMQAYNALINEFPDTPAAGLARERLAGLAQVQAQPQAAGKPQAPAPAPLGGRTRVGHYLCTVPGLFGAGSLWCGRVRGEDAERYEMEIRRVAVGGVFTVGLSRAPCTGDVFISQLSVGSRVVVPKGCMAH